MGQGLAACGHCTPASPGEGGDGLGGRSSASGGRSFDASLVPVSRSGAWQPPNAALVCSNAARLALRLDGGASSSFLVAKGHVVRLAWSSSKDHPGLRTPPMTIPDVPSLPARVVQVGAGEAHALLLAVGPAPRVFALGANDHGQLGLGDSMPRRDAGRAFEVLGLEASMLVGGVACGGHVSMALSQRGEAWSWGRSEECGALGHGCLPVACVSSPTPILPLRRKVRAAQVATSGCTSLCLSHLGAIFSWGGGVCGLHGHGHQTDELTPKAIQSLADVPIVQVAMGPLHALGLSSQGEVYTWGRAAGAFGRDPQLQLAPKFVDALREARIVQVAAGGDHSLALSDQGEVFGWGAHASGALGGVPASLDPSQRYSLVHRLNLRLGKVREIGCGRCHSLFLAAPKQEGEAVLQGQAQASNLYICGQAAPSAGEHPATVLLEEKRGNAPLAPKGAAFAPPPRSGGAAGGAHATGASALLAPVSGAPLRLTRVDIGRVLDLLASGGGAGGA